MDLAAWVLAFAGRRPWWVIVLPAPSMLPKLSCASFGAVSCAESEGPAASCGSALLVCPLVLHAFGGEEQYQLNGQQQLCMRPLAPLLVALLRLRPLVTQGLFSPSLSSLSSLFLLVSLPLLSHALQQRCLLIALLPRHGAMFAWKLGGTWAAAARSSKLHCMPYLNLGLQALPQLLHVLGRSCSQLSPSVGSRAAIGGAVSARSALTVS